MDLQALFHPAVNPSQYLFDPWDKEIFAREYERGVTWQFRNTKYEGAYFINYIIYKSQEKVSLLWCFKHMWNLDIPILNEFDEYKKHEKKGLLLQQMLRLCIQCHWYYKQINPDVTYRDAGNWFNDCRQDCDQIVASSIFNRPDQKRGSKRADVKRLRDVELFSLIGGYNPHSKDESPHLWTLIETSIRLGHTDSDTKIPDVARVWEEYLKAYNAYITFIDRSPDYGSLFTSRGKVLLQCGRGNTIKEIVPKESKKLNKAIHLKTKTPKAIRRKD